MLTMKEAQQDKTDTGRIVNFTEKQRINGDVAKGVMPSGETDSDMPTDTWERKALFSCKDIIE